MFICPIMFEYGSHFLKGLFVDVLVLYYFQYPTDEKKLLKVKQRDYNRNHAYYQ